MEMTIDYMMTMTQLIEQTDHNKMTQIMFWQKMKTFL